MNYFITMPKLIPFVIAKTNIAVDTLTKNKFDIDNIYFILTVNAFLYIGKTNNVQFGLTLIDSKIAFYQKVKGTWTITDTTELKGHICLKEMDLNGDGFEDIRISSVYNGDLLTRAFLYDTKTNTFKLNESFGQPNIEYDNTNKFVKFWFHCKKGESGIKFKGIVVDDRLKTDSTVIFSIDRNNKKGVLKLYKGLYGANNNPVKIESGNPDSIWIKFSKTFWILND